MTNRTATPLRSWKRALQISLSVMLAYLGTAGLWIAFQIWKSGEALPFTGAWGADVVQWIWRGGVLLALLVVLFGPLIYSFFRDERYYRVEARLAWVVFGIVMALVVLAVQATVPAVWLKRPFRFFTTFFTGLLAAYVGHLVAFKMLYRPK
jgi:hypothetical protein